MSDWLDEAITKSEQDEELNRAKVWQKWLHAEQERRRRAERDRDAALAAMWGMICVATDLRKSFGHACTDAAKEIAALVQDRDKWRELALRHERAGKSCA